MYMVNIILTNLFMVNIILTNLFMANITLTNLFRTLTSHLKQARWKSFPKALILGALVCPFFGIIGFLHVEHLIPYSLLKSSVQYTLFSLSKVTTFPSMFLWHTSHSRQAWWNLTSPTMRASCPSGGIALPQAAHGQLLTSSW